MKCVVASKLHPSLNAYVKSKSYRDITFDNKRKCYRVGKASRPGLHRTLKRRFYPAYKRTRRRRTTLKKGSTKKVGSRVDAELAAAIATQGKGTKKMHRLTRALLEFFTRDGHRIEASQVPVVIPGLRCATQADIFTSKVNPISRRRELWLWEVKTGYAPGLTTKRKTSTGTTRKLRAPHSKGDDTLLNHFYLQAHYTAEGFRCYAKMRVDQVRVVQVYQEGTGKQRRFKVQVRPLPAWIKR